MSSDDDGGAAAWANRILGKVFGSCSDDPKGAVHRAWGLSLVLVLVYFTLSIFETINLNARGGSRALVIASVWTGTMHMVLALLGTFILKRFPTSFSIGFLLGILLVLANQNLILFGTFSNYDYGSQGMNQAFGALAFALFAVLAIFAALLFHFSKSIIVAPVDAKGFGRRGGKEEAFQQNDSTDNENSQA